MATECTETVYINSATGLKDRLTRIETIITGLEDAQIEVVGKSGVEEYTVDDGQVKIMTTYRSASDIAKAIKDYESIKQTIINKLNGRGMVLRPWQGLY